ncbi:MAG: LPXTG-motif cell wall anchor domain protein [Herbinix sp.]|jgi:LPXTG-motif cell wall-anchored protein|nr:LPXTG-motif cell wall anchor domain protein [Herbinix sp.]
MRSSGLRKVFTAIGLTAVLMMMTTVSAFAATTYLVQDGAFTNAGFINAGEAKEGTIEGPGNWTQLNLGDAAVDAPYLHVIIKATGDTAAAQFGVSDLFTFNLADLGVTLTEEYQDVVLPVQEKGITMLSWFNCMGLDGGSSVYTVKDVFLSDDAASTTLAAVATTEATPTEEAAPKTGDTATTAIIAAFAMLTCAGGYVALKKYRKAF